MRLGISWANEKVNIGNTNGYGSGVYAAEHISKGELVAVFGGYVIAIADLLRIQEQDKKAYDVIFETGYQITDELVFSPVSADQFSTIEYLNHSCDPNCGFRNQIELVAMKDIQAGQEVTMDYAMCITSDLFTLPECLCGTSNCRKTVVGSDWMNPVLQRKYSGYFQPYITDKIKNLVKE